MAGRLSDQGSDTCTIYRPDFISMAHGGIFYVDGAFHFSFVGKITGPIDVFFFMLIITSFELHLCDKM